MPAADGCEAAEQLVGRGFAVRAAEQLIADGLGVAVGRLRPADEELADCRERGELDSSCVNE